MQLAASTAATCTPCVQAWRAARLHSSQQHAARFVQHFSWRQQQVRAGQKGHRRLL